MPDCGNSAERVRASKGTLRRREAIRLRESGVAATLEGCAAAVTGGPSGVGFAAGCAGQGSRVPAVA